MHHPTVARNLTYNQQQILLEHLRHGDVVPVPIVRRRNRDIIVNSLIKLRLIRSDAAGRNTLLREDGRYVLAALLGSFADALVESAGAELMPITNPEWRKALAKVQAEYGVEAPSVERLPASA